MTQDLVREGNGTPLQYSCLENPMDGGASWAAVHGVTEGRTRLSDFTFTSHFHALEKEMATHSSVLAWRIPGMGEPGGLPSMGLHRVGHDWSDLAAAAATVEWEKLSSKSLGFLELCQTLLAKVLILYLTRCKKDGGNIKEWGKTLFSTMPLLMVRKSFLVMVLCKN